MLKRKQNAKRVLKKKISISRLIESWSFNHNSIFLIGGEFMALSDEQQQILTHAHRLIDEQKVEQAIELLDDLYGQTSDAQVNQTLVEVLNEDKQYHLAQQLMEEKYLTYFRTEKQFILMIDVFLSNHQLIKAQIAKLKCDNVKWQQLAAVKIEHQELQDQQELGETIKTNSRQFVHLGDETLGQQQIRFNKAYQLPQSEYIKDAQFLLRDPYVHQLIKSSILQTLQKLEVNLLVKYLWIDEQEYEINPSELTAIENVPAYQKVIRHFDEQQGQNDPIGYQNNLQVFKLEMALVFPRITETIIDPQIWVTVALNIMQGKSVDQHQQVTKKIYQAQTRLQKMINQLFLEMTNQD